MRMWDRTERSSATKDAQQALHASQPEHAVSAIAQLVDLACEVGDYEYFRSADPVEAARFVVSDTGARCG